MVIGGLLALTVERTGMNRKIWGRPVLILSFGGIFLCLSLLPGSINKKKLYKQRLAGCREPFRPHTAFDLSEAAARHYGNCNTHPAYFSESEMKAMLRQNGYYPY